MLLDTVEQKSNKLDSSIEPLTDLGLRGRCARHRLGALLCLQCLDLGFGKQVFKKGQPSFPRRE